MIFNSYVKLPVDYLVEYISIFWLVVDPSEKWWLVTEKMGLGWHPIYDGKIKAMCQTTNQWFVLDGNHGIFETGDWIWWGGKAKEHCIWWIFVAAFCAPWNVGSLKIMDASRLKMACVAADHHCLQKWSKIEYPWVIFGYL